MQPGGFLHTCVQSITNSRYYRTLLGRPIGVTIWFFTLGMLLIGLTAGGLQAQRDIQWWQGKLEASRVELVAAFPAELVLRWDGTKLTSTAPLSTVPYPHAFASQVETYELPSSLVRFSLGENEQMAGDADSLVTISSTQMSLRTVSGGLHTLPLSQVLPSSPIEVNKDTIENESALALSSLKPVLFLSVGLISVGLFILSLFVSRLLIVAIESVFCYLVLQALGKRMPYFGLVRISMHVIVFAEVANQVALAVYPTLSVSWLTVSYWALMIYVLLSILSDTPARPPRAPEEL